MKPAILALALLWGAAARADSPVQSCIAAVDQTVSEMAVDGVEVTVVYDVCGQINAGYQASTRSMLVCLEALDLPTPVLRTVIAHEMAHAMIDQDGIPIPGSEEPAADELGALVQIVNGHSADVLATADFFEGMGQEEDVSDEHQSSAKRAAVLRCLVAGSEATTDNLKCRDYFVHAAQVWVRLLSTYHAK